MVGWLLSYFGFGLVTNPFDSVCKEIKNKFWISINKTVENGYILYFSLKKEQCGLTYNNFGKQTETKNNKKFESYLPKKYDIIKLNLTKTLIKFYVNNILCNKISHLGSKYKYYPVITCGNISICKFYVRND